MNYRSLVRSIVVYALLGLTAAVAGCKSSSGDNANLMADQVQPGVTPCQQMNDRFQALTREWSRRNLGQLNRPTCSMFEVDACQCGDEMVACDRAFIPTPEVLPETCTRLNSDLCFCEGAPEPVECRSLHEGVASGKLRLPQAASEDLAMMTKENLYASIITVDQQLQANNCR